MLVTFGKVVLTQYCSISVVELIRACAESNDGMAWEEFVARFQRPICLSILRTAYKVGNPPKQLVDDLVQETYLKLCSGKCRLLLEFAMQHPEAVVGYIKTIAVNVAHDHFKALHSQRRGEGETDQFQADVEPPAHTGGYGGPDAMEREVLLRQIDNRLHSCAAGPNQERDCLIFWFYYLQGMSAKAIAALATIKLTAKGVEAVVFRLVRCVREQLAVENTQSSEVS
jgi:RNA polymerase sigma-70 factor (ECF subfamily)